MKIKLSSNRRGSTLLMVMILSAVLILIAAAITTAVLTANEVSEQNKNAQQALFTARSAVNITKQWIIENQSKNPDLVRDLVNSTSSSPCAITNIKNSMGECSVKAEYWDSDNNKKSDTPTSVVKIIGIGTYKGVTRSVSGFMQNIRTFKYAIYIWENLITDRIELSEGSNIFVNNSIVLSRKFNAESITTLQNITINAPPDGEQSVIGEVHAMNDVAIGENVIVTGDVTSSQVNSIRNHGTILGNQLNENSEYIDRLTFTADKLKEIDYTKYDKDYPASTVRTIDSTEITGSGVIQSTDFINDKTLTIDTTAGDVWIYFQNELNLQNVTFLKKGKHKLYLFVLPDTHLRFDNCTIKSTNKISNDIFLLSDKTSAHIIIGDSNTLDACFFLFHQAILGTVGANSVINGSVIAASIYSNSTLYINYKAPDITSTPMDDCIKDSDDCISYWAFTEWGQNF